MTNFYHVSDTDDTGVQEFIIDLDKVNRIGIVQASDIYRIIFSVSGDDNYGMEYKTEEKLRDELKNVLMASGTPRSQNIANLFKMKRVKEKSSEVSELMEALQKATENLK